MSSEPWLAIDGGQSQIRLRLSTGAQAQADGVQHRPGGNVPGMLASIRAALADLDHPQVQVAALGMSGLFQEPGPLAELGAGVVAATGARTVLLTGDDLTCHAGALRGEPGVVAAIGTGTAVIGLAPGGQFNLVDGRGYLLGDDGSGFQLGQHGLRAVLEHAEELHPATALTDLAIARYGPVADLAHTVYRSQAPVASVAAFARDVITAAREQDPTAQGLVRTSMQALARSIRAAAAGFGAGRVPVVVVGGLMRSRDVLGPVLEQALAQVLPAARLQDPEGTPLDGAAWLAQQEAGPYAPMVHTFPRHGAAARTQSPTTTHPAGPHVTGAGGAGAGGGPALPIPAGGLVVSCQAPPGSPLGEAVTMAAMARGAQAGGAVGIRANGAADVAAIAAATTLPIIGIAKTGPRDGIFITPTVDAAAQVVRAGAAMVAVDGTDRPRPGGISLAELIEAIHAELAVPVMADCDSMASAEHAARAGADVLATTLSGYTGITAAGTVPTEPDLDLLTAMCTAFDLPVIAEGRYHRGEHVAAAFAAGAHAVVVGTAITDPVALTRSFVAASPLAPDAT